MSAASTALLRACFLLLCLAAGTRQLAIKEFLVPAAIEVGGSAELRCQYELAPDESDDALYVKWWWRPESAPIYERRQIYQRINGQPAEAIHHAHNSKIEIKENDTIVLVEVTPTDSGIYECEVTNIDELRVHNQLTAYYMGLGPILNISQIKDDNDSEKDPILIECHAESVAPKPEMIVSINGKEINITSFVEDDDQDGMYDIYGNTTVIPDDTDSQQVRCEIFYASSSIIHRPYVDTKTYEPAGCDLHSTTEMPEDATEPETSPESLQNYSDDGVQLHYSWPLLTCAALLAYLQTIL